MINDATVQTAAYGSLRTFGSRAHCRVLAASTKALLSLAFTTPASGCTPATCNTACAPASAAMAFKWPNASRTQSTA